MARVTDSELVSICEGEISAASGYSAGELSEQRANAMDYYLGEPYGDEVEGRSQIRTREVLDTVELVMPSLMRIFADQGNLVQFDPVGPEDEEAAEQETDRVNFEFWKRNRGVYNLYNLCKDALLSKTGVLKYYIDEGSEEREEYTSVDDIELGELMNDPTVSREVMEHEMNDDGTHHVVFRVVVPPRIRIEPCPPEEVGVNMDARTPYIKDCDFVYHRTRKTAGQLVEEGYDKAFVDSLPSNDDVETEERLARRHLSDESDSLDSHLHKSMRVIWVTECYIRIDRDDDGINELLRVTLATGSQSGSGARLMNVEEVDEIPFVSATPIIITHKFYGLSLADLTMDIQRIKSTIVRQIVDNMYLANNQRVLMNEKKVNMDDWLTSRPGGVVRFDEAGSPGEVFSPIPSQPVPAESFGLLEYLDELRKQRTGIGDEVGGLDKTTLANVNTGVFALAYDAARAKIELIARVIAEMALVPLFQGIHGLLRSHSDKEEMVRIRGEWIPVNPSKWRSREDMTVLVGMGQASRERKMMGLERIMEMQKEVWKNGGAGQLLLPQHIYKSHADYTELWGVDADLYWVDPRKVPPPPPKGPSAQEMLMQAQAQALVTDAQSKVQRNQVEAQKVAAEMRMKEREQQIRLAEAAAKSELERLKAEQVAIKTQLETAGKVASIQGEQQKRAVDAQVKEMELRLDHLKSERDREVDVFKVQMESYTKMLEYHGVVDPQVSAQKQREREEQEMLERQEKERAEALKMQEEESRREAYEQDKGQMRAALLEMARVNQEIMDRLHASEEDRSKPKEILRDELGLAISIGDKRIVRDANGLMVRLE